jgi:2-oxoglutarate dehydrogenase E2 component (dihydrolipoamide succinyltransferase)
VAVKAAADGTDAIPLSNIRKRTGEHMVRSKETSPHVLTAMEVDFEAVDRVRGAHKGAWKEQEGFSLTYLPFVSRAVVDAIEDFPFLNASLGEGGGNLEVHHPVHLAIAVDLDFEGLLAPVVRNAESKRLRAIAREIRDLADRAHQKKLSADEIQGGTFTITNPGQYGTMMQFPVINQPQVAILSTDGVHRKPVVVTAPDGTEAIAVHSVGVLALAWDHRAFDGAYAAAFLARLKEIIETRDWEAEL